MTDESTATADVLIAPTHRRSVFAGLDICGAAGFRLARGVSGPNFDDDVWSFGEVIGVARYISPSVKIMDFTIVPPRWRRLAKEYLAALLLPGHKAVAVLPHAHRNPLGLSTSNSRLANLASWLHWLDERGVTSLREVGQHECDAYLHADGQLVPNAISMARVIIELAMYSELFTDDCYAPEFRPFNGRSANQVVGNKAGGENSTPPVAQEILQPLLAAALYIVDTLGPHVVTLRRQRLQQTQAIRAMPASRLGDHIDSLRAAVRRHVDDGEALPIVSTSERRRRLAIGWSADDPLFTVAFAPLAQEIGVKQLHNPWWEALRPDLEAAVAAVGVDHPFARHAALVPRADHAGEVGWTEPLSERQSRYLEATTLAACVIVVAAVSGMRMSELNELNVGCSTVDEVRPGFQRYRLASRIVKRQQMGGVADEWVVVREAHQAVSLVEQLIDDDTVGAPLFRTLSFASRYNSFRTWVNSAMGQRLGLQPIPDGVVTLRMLRRTLAIELAYRPAGLLAAKIHLKHVSVATTEGYAGRPGGAQAKLLAEIGQHEQDRNMELLLEEWRNYQDGVMPAGPGARELVEFFDGVDGKLAQSAPKTAATDQEVRSLLTKRAKVLHLGTGNYCWFSDPSKALCLKLAGTPQADRPLIGMCDSARCPQATHHPRHRPVWADAVEKNTVFLGALGASRKTERLRLEGEVARAARVVATIDAAATNTDTEGAA